MMDWQNVTSKSPEADILSHAIRMVALLRRDAIRLSKPRPNKFWCVMDGRLYQVLGDNGYSAYGNIKSFCARMKKDRKPIPWA